MKKVVFAVIVSALMLSGFAPTVNAEVAQQKSVTKTLRITKFHKAVNKVCPKQTDKMYILAVKISGGKFVEGKSSARVVQRKGRVLRTDDVVTPGKREVDFYFFPKSRKSKIKKVAKRNVFTVRFTDPSATLRVGKLRGECLERLDG